MSHTPIQRAGSEPGAERAPRVLTCDLEALSGTGKVAFAGIMRPLDLSTSGAPGGSTAGLEHLGRFGGAALALALVSDAAASGREPLVLAVGEAVRDGLPTAARVTVAGRGPLTGLYAEGQVGSDLARRLGSVADALVLESSAGPPERAPGEGPGELGRVLVIDADRLECLVIPALAGLAGLSVQQAHERLERELGPCATLVTGPAGERGVPLASLAACSSSSDGPPHFVGRGGLGALFGRIGLKALCVRAAAPEGSTDHELAAALQRSPRLEGRAVGGTLELYGADAAQGELPLDRAQARSLADTIERARADRHGCARCPTPCGWTFARPGGEAAQSARFAATQALGHALGLPDFEDALDLLARCDAAGLDAKETGAALALLTAESAERPERATLAGWIDALGRPEGHARLAQGAERLGRALGRPTTTAKGSAVRDTPRSARLLGQCVSARGADPMRTFAFLSAAAGTGSEQRASAGARAGTGQLVAWHEDLACALDATGFCAFSAAALLADGVCDLDQLARWIAPRALMREPAFQADPGGTLLALGERMVLWQRRLQERWARPGASADLDRPEWARARLEQPGMWPEYRAVRGLDEAGRLLPPARARIGAGAALRPRPKVLAPVHHRSNGSAAAGGVARRGPGRVQLVAPAWAGGDRSLEMELPASVADVLERGSRGPGVGPVVCRAGQVLGPEDVVQDGDRLDLVLVVPGG